MRNYGYSSAIANQSLGQAQRSQPTKKTIPFDHLFRFDLQGISGNRVQDVVEISMEGVFVALSLGYSLVRDERKAPRTFTPEINERTVPPIPVLAPIFTRSQSREGILGPLHSIIAFFVHAMPGAEISILDSNLKEIESTKGGSLSREGFVRMNLKDPILIESGKLLRAWDKTNNLLSQAFVVNILSTPMINPDPITKRLPVADDRTVFVYGSPRSRNDSPDNKIMIILLKTSSTSPPIVKGPFDLEQIPLDYDFPDNKPTSFQAIGRADLQETLSPGDVLLVRTVEANSTGDHPFSTYIVPRPKVSTIPLGALAAGLERKGLDLTGGFRLSPNIANLVANDIPLDQLDPETRKRVFLTGGTAAEEVSFLYSIDVLGSGREYQNKPIHNIAGLGIGNGDRPFRPFAKPVMFEPRSSIRIQVEEISRTPGTLNIVLQGYKMLGTGRIPG